MTEARETAKAMRAAGITTKPAYVILKLFFACWVSVNVI